MPSVKNAAAAPVSIRSPSVASWTVTSSPASCRKASGACSTSSTRTTTVRSLWASTGMAASEVPPARVTVPTKLSGVRRTSSVSSSLDGACVVSVMTIFLFPSARGADRGRVRPTPLDPGTEQTDGGDGGRQRDHEPLRRAATGVRVDAEERLDPLRPHQGEQEQQSGQPAEGRLQPEAGPYRIRLLEVHHCASPSPTARA